MSTQKSKLPYSIIPSAGNHAIEVMAFAIEFTNPLSAQELTQLEKIYTESLPLKGIFPNKRNLEQFQFAVSTSENGPSSRVESEPLGGLELISQPDASGKYPWTLAILREFMTCRCQAYEDWRTVKPRAFEIMKPVLDSVINENRRIKAVGLQYQDAFLVNGDISEFDLLSVFRGNSPLLPPFVFKHQSLWHVHQGWLSSGPDELQVLNLVNIEATNQNSSLKLQIDGQHRVLSVDIRGNTIARTAENLERDFDHMHDENKKLLRDLLNDNTLSAIGLSI